MEAVLVSREQDRGWSSASFSTPGSAIPTWRTSCWRRCCRGAEGKAEAGQAQAARQRSAGAAAALWRRAQAAGQGSRLRRRHDGQRAQRLQHADFNALSASEYHLVERLAREIACRCPALPVRRIAARHARRAAALGRARCASASQTGGELLLLRRLQRNREPLPLLVLVDVSGSMERYARLLLAFLHAATRSASRRRDVFAFGTHLTDLTPAFRLADTDAMLPAAGAAIDDFAGGTRLGAQALSCDYIFIDPPYRLHEAYDEALGFLSQSRILKPSSIVIAEHDKRHDPGESFGALTRYRQLMQGDSVLSFYRLS